MTVELTRVSAPVSFEEFASVHGLTVEVKERSRSLCESYPHIGWPLGRFYATFKGVVGIDGIMQVGVVGKGSTPESAVADFASLIASMKLGRLSDRATFQCPNEWEPVPFTKDQQLKKVKK